MPNSNMPKHAERRNMPEGPQLCMQMTKLKHAKIKHALEGPHLCMQMTKFKHAKIKHAEARSRPTDENA